MDYVAANLAKWEAADKKAGKSRATDYYTKYSKDSMDWAEAITKAAGLTAGSQ